METMIDTLLSEKINKIFLEMQKYLGITNGDVEPFDEYDLMEKQIEISLVIGRILRKQRGEVR